MGKKRIGRLKVRKLKGWVWFNWNKIIIVIKIIIKRKTTKKKRYKSYRWSKFKQLPTTYPLMPSQPPSRWPPQTSPTVLLLSMMPRGVEYPSSQLESAVLAVSSPSSLWTPSFLTGGVRWEAGNAAMCKPCPEITTRSLCYQHWFQHKSQTAPYQVLWRKRPPSQPKAAHRHSIRKLTQELPWKISHTLLPKSEPWR